MKRYAIKLIDYHRTEELLNAFSREGWEFLAWHDDEWTSTNGLVGIIRGAIFIGRES